MNKGIFVVGGLVVVAVVGSWWYLSSEKAMEEKAMMAEKVAMQEKAAMEQKAMKEKSAADTVMQEKATMEKKAAMQQEVPPVTGNGAMMKKEENAMMIKGGQYMPYDASQLAFAKDGKVVLFFRASWCPTCRALDADIKAKLSQIPQSVLILDVDYDKYTDLRKQYGVTYQHTLVQVNASGNMITKWSGSADLDELLKQVK
jgi:thiol-disulfide isomerase/thioredoxin